MNGWSVPPLVMAGVLLYVGLYHLLVHLRVRRAAENRSFGLLCLALAVYDVSCALLYNSPSPELGARWQIWQVVSSGLAGACFLWFVSDYAGTTSWRTYLAMAVGYLPVPIPLLLGHRSWAVSEIPAVKHMSLPFALEATYNEMEVGPALMFEMLVGIAVFVYTWLLIYRLFARGQRKRALPLAAATGLFCAAVISDSLVAMKALTFVYTIEYAFVGLVVLMAFSMSSELLRTGAIERALAESQRTYREVFDSTSEAIFVHDADTGAVLDVNQAVTELYGLTREEALRMSVGDLSARCPEFGSAAGLSNLARAITHGPQVFEWLARRKNGDEFWVEVALRSAVVAGQQRVLAVVRDISDRKQAEAALAESQRFSEQVVGAIPEIVYIFDIVAQRSVYANRNVGTLLGYSPEEVAAMGELLLPAIVHPDDLPVISGLLTRWESARDDEILSSEYRVRSKSGERLRWWMGRDKVFKRRGDGSVQQVIGSANDITERRRAELALQESEERYRQLVDASPSGILLLSISGQILFANPMALHIIGAGTGHEVAGRPILDLVIPEDRHGVTVRLRAVLIHNITSRPFSVRISRLAGEIRTLELIGVKVTFRGAPAELVVGNDITDRVRGAEERAQLESQLLHSQKMEAVGRLAGGVAHDFNNLLQAMLSYAEVLATRIHDTEAIRVGLGELAQHARRGARLSRQLLLFSRQDASHREPLDLAGVVLEAAGLVRRLLRESIELDLRPAMGPLPVVGDRGQLEQVVMNLVVNAADAMPQGGRLTISTGTTDGGFGYFEVSDTGHGISDELREQIFEPFFTTKPAGVGSGLGLSVVHGIVTAHGGRIDLWSEVGHGATFRILLPLSADQVELRSPANVPPLDPGGLATGQGERVLLVEDEQGARQALVQILGTLKYHVIAVASVGEALAIPTSPPFDLLLSDVVLPDGFGNELASRLQKRWPGIAVVLMSGYAQDEAVRGAVRSGELHFLHKPFDMATLSLELRRALSASPADGTTPAV